MIIRSLCRCIFVLQTKKSLLLCRTHQFDYILKEAHSNVVFNSIVERKWYSNATINDDLDEIFKFKDTNISNWIVEVMFELYMRIINSNKFYQFVLIFFIAICNL